MYGICESCGNPCGVGIVDYGIGPYEFWGAPGFDSQPAAVSDCCEAPARDEDGKDISTYDIEYEAECAKAEYYADLQEEREMFPDDYDW